MSVRDSEGTGLVEFDCADVHQSSLGHIVENSVATRALLEVVECLGNIDFRCPARIVSIEGASSGARSIPDMPVQVRLDDGQMLETSLLLAADGANSQIREMAGFRLRSWDYRHRAIVTTIRTETPHGFTARQWFMASGPLAFLPLVDSNGDGHHVSIVWSQQEAEAQRLMSLDSGAFGHELTRASESSLGEVLSVAERFCIPLVQRHAVDYVQPGIALVGDAAHSIHPLAGQGVNLGFQDVRVLVEEVCRGLDRRLSPGDISCLRRYQRRRKPENLAMMVAMEALKGLFGQQIPAFRILRNEGMTRVNRLAPLKNLLIRQAMGL
jgi:2-octaprenylphenol hydroxylase